MCQLVQLQKQLSYFDKLCSKLAMALYSVAKKRAVTISRDQKHFEDL